MGFVRKKERKEEGHVKHILRIMAVFAAVMLNAGCVFADTNANEIDPDETISLTVILQEDEEAFCNIGITIYRAADVEVHAGTAVYIPLIGGIDYDGMSASENEAAAAALCEEDLSGLESYTGVTDQDGKVVFADLEAGAWLIVQTSGEDSCRFSPFLAFAPQCGADQNWTYDVTAYPKSGTAEVVSQTSGVKTGDSDFMLICLVVFLIAAGSAGTWTCVRVAADSRSRSAAEKRLMQVKSEV